MNPSGPFILRPIATSLLMIGLLLVGVVAYKQLPVSALPQVDYPTIQVVTFYPGASPEVMTSSITAPLERQFGQLPGLNQMTSTSSGGSSLITLQLTLDLNIEDAAPVESRRPRGYPAGTENFAAFRGRSGEHQRRPKTGGACPSQSCRACLLRADDGKRAQRHRPVKRQSSQR